ncbi:YbgA family protein [Rheinheimera fenheensis]|uniref:YbgA family protein n=1 Tax=Rheinheimera fenheensis TaxID=3152295 RepID=UPI00325D7779
MTVKIGISACVLGEKVRFDGGHKGSSFCMQQLASLVQYVPVCPEMAIGMPSPRPAIRLQLDDSQQVQLVQSNNPAISHTEAMLAFSDKKLPQLAGLSGYIVCAKSPSCGMERVRLFDAKGQQMGKLGVGLFTHQLMQKYPWLPVEEDGRLFDPALKENFICRVFSCYDFQQSMLDGFSVGKLVAFHSRYKFLVMAHSPVAYRELGRLVANAKLFAAEELQQRYLLELMQALKNIATRKQHANVLQHLQGFLKHGLSAEAKQELASLIDRYRQGFVPLLAPVTLLQHHLKQHPNAYVSAQRYFNPYPETLGLRA